MADSPKARRAVALKERKSRADRRVGVGQGPRPCRFSHKHYVPNAGEQIYSERTKAIEKRKKEWPKWPVSRRRNKQSDQIAIRAA